MKTRLRLLIAALLIAALPAHAQSWPQKGVRIVVPFPPGGGADALARLMAPKLTEIWKQQVIIENKPGASGHIGADAVAKSPSNGYTLLMSSTASLTGYPNCPAYAAAKHGIVGLTKGMALDFREANIRANCYCPASVDTAMVSKFIPRVSRAGA